MATCVMSQRAINSAPKTPKLSQIEFATAVWIVGLILLGTGLAMPVMAGLWPNPTALQQTCFQTMQQAFAGAVGAFTSLFAVKR